MSLCRGTSLCRDSESDSEPRLSTEVLAARNPTASLRSRPGRLGEGREKQRNRKREGQAGGGGGGSRNVIGADFHRKHSMVVGKHRRGAAVESRRLTRRSRRRREVRSAPSRSGARGASAASAPPAAAAAMSSPLPPHSHPPASPTTPATQRPAGPTPAGLLWAPRSRAAATGLPAARRPPQVPRPAGQLQPGSAPSPPSPPPPPPPLRRRRGGFVRAGQLDRPAAAGAGGRKRAGRWP
jgi:hypothetical protein